MGNAPVKEIKELVALADQGNDINQLEVATGLAFWAQKDENLSRIAEGGGVKVLLQLCRSRSPDIQRKALLALHSFSRNERFRGYLEEQGAIPVLVEQLQQSRDDVVLEHTTGIMANMVIKRAKRQSEEGENPVAKYVKEGAIAPLIGWARVGNDLVRRRAVRGLNRLIVTGEALDIFVEEEGLDVLLEAIRSNDPNIRCVAARFLGDIAANDSVKTKLARRGAIEVLMSRTEDDEIEVCRSVLHALYFLTTIEENVQNLVLHDWRRMVELLKARDAYVQQCAAAVLANLVALDREHLIRVGSLGAVKPLLKLLGSPDVNLQFEGSRIFMALTLHSKLRQQIADAHGIELLASLLASGNRGVQKHAVWSLANMAADVVHGDSLISSCLHPLITLIGHNTEPEVQAEASRALMNLASHPENRENFVIKGAVGWILSAMRFVSGDVLTYLAQILEFLAREDDQKYNIALEGGLRPLLMLLGSEDQIVQDHAKRTLACMSSTSKCHGECHNLIKSLQLSLSGFEVAEQPRPHTVFAVRVQTTFRTWTVWRRYKEFRVFDKELVHQFPHDVFPSLPPRVAFSMDPAVIDGRVKQLEVYLKGLQGKLANVPEMFPLFVEFLQLDDVRLAAFSGDEEFLGYLLSDSTIEVEKSNEVGWTALLFASLQGEPRVCELLLARGANVNVADQDGITPLHTVGIIGHESVAVVLLRHHATVNARDAVGMTPLHYAARLGHAQIVDLLVRHHADPRLTNRDRKTAADLARQFNQNDVLKALGEQQVVHELVPLHGTLAGEPLVPTSSSAVGNEEEQREEEEEHEHEQHEQHEQQQDEEHKQQQDEEHKQQQDEEHKQQQDEEHKQQQDEEQQNVEDGAPPPS